MNKSLQFWKLMFSYVLLSFLIGCASTGNPNGGPRDKTPPRIVEEKSAKNFSTNYVPAKLELVFDEWIELKNQQREILISPPFFKTPKITSRGKKVTVEFPEEEPLREDATYTINFGKSIVDFTEGNAAEGFRFVFATGDKIDSLGLTGNIVEARDGKPVKDILVLLYDIVEDSVVVSEKPFYYARSDESGGFKFENLKNDTFKLLVLEDLNFNYLLDEELERLAFPDSLLILTDSATYNPSLRLFKPEQRFRILNSSSKTPGLISTDFNKPASEVDYRFLYPNDFEPLVEMSEDTLLLWFTETRDSVGVIYGVDTLDFNINPFDSIFYQKKLSVIKYNAGKTILAPFDSLQISFNSPLSSIDTALIRLTNKPVTVNDKATNGGGIDSIQRGKNIIPTDIPGVDSSAMKLDTMVQDSVIQDSVFQDPVVLDTIVPTEIIDTSLIKDTIGILDTISRDSLLIALDTLGIDSSGTKMDTALIEYDFTYSTHLRKLVINSKWIEKYEYRLELLPGAITDIYGRQNDTLTLDFKTAGLDEFGSITLNLSAMDSVQQYVVLLKLNDEIIKKTIVPDTTIKKIEHKQLRVNTYSVELIKDDDGNGEWTTGDYWKKRQPEEIKSFTLDKLRENWDMEANIFWNQKETIQNDSLGIGQDSLMMKPPPGMGKKPPPTRTDNPRGRSKGGKPNPKGKND